MRVFEGEETGRIELSDVELFHDTLLLAFYSSEQDEDFMAAPPSFLSSSTSQN